MITIKRLEQEGLCVFCDKTKEVAAVAVDGEASPSHSEILLCWADIRKMAKMRMRMTGQSPKSPTATSKSAEPK